MSFHSLHQVQRTITTPHTLPQKAPCSLLRNRVRHQLLAMMREHRAKTCHKTQAGPLGRHACGGRWAPKTASTRNLWSIKYGTLCTTVMTQFCKVIDDTHSRQRRLRWSPVHFTVLMAQLLIVLYAMTTLTNLDHEYRLPRGSRTIGNWMSEQHEVALQHAASNDI